MKFLSFLYYLMLRNPLVFVFNILESQHCIYQTILFDHIKDIFKQDNQPCVFLPVRNPPTTNLQKRADYIHSRVSEMKNPHLVAFSVAGLDCRHAICKYGTKVESLTTISSPHYGSHLADWMRAPERIDGLVEPLCRVMGITMRAFDELNTKNIKNLNKTLAPRDEVKKYSISSWKSPEAMTHALYDLSKEITKSMPFEKRTTDGAFFTWEAELPDHLGTFDMDHTELIGSNLKNNCAPIYRLVLDNLVRHERIKANLAV